MRAVRLHGIRDLRAEDVPAPAAPGRGEVTLAVTAAGICGSDLHNYATGAWITRAPSIVGHEFSGIVTARGAGVGHVAIGQRVVVDSRHLCGTCAACLAGRGQVCENLGFLGEAIDGGFAEAVTLPARNVIAAPDGVPDPHLAMAEPLAVALHALRRLSLPKGAPLLIAGCGPIGGLIALLASRAGHPVAITDRNSKRAELVAAATGAKIVTLAEVRPPFAVDTTGSDAVIAALLDGLPGAGVLALVGIGRSLPLIDPTRLVEAEITLLGCHAFTDADLADAAAMLPDLGGALDAFIAARITLDQVPDAYGRHLRGEVTDLKTIILCEAP